MIVVGILGGGQLGRMLALAGARLGLRFRVYDPSAEACAGHVAALTVGEFDNAARLDEFASGLDVLTYEFENVPVEAVERLAARAPTYPPAGALRVCQDRLEEKTLFRRLGVGTPDFRAVSTRAELDAAAAAVGFPSVLKTRRFGYDGKGQSVLRHAGEVEHAWRLLGEGRTPLILEAFVRFRRELSILAVAGRGGERAFYPLVENRHAGGILRESRAPAPGLEASLQQEAEGIANRAIDAMGYVGLLAIELFEVNGGLLANEMAPRVHNSGHWTMDGAETSQFENHLRAILGLPLGSTAVIGGAGVAGMVNLIGEAPALELLAALGGARVHLYGKEGREGRKIGHINLLASTPAALELRMNAAREIAG